jgi:protein-tyrosine phosphatase
MAVDATEIVPGIYQGAMPPAGGDVARAGFSLLVLAALGPEYPRPPTSASYPGVRVLHVPLDDNFELVTADEGRRAIAAAREVAMWARSGHRVLVTCHLGRNRSGLISALAVRLLTGLSPMRAIARVQSQRSGALRNPAMQRFLIAEGEKLRALR